MTFLKQHKAKGINGKNDDLDTITAVIREYNADDGKITFQVVDKDKSKTDFTFGSLNVNEATLKFIADDYWADNVFKKSKQICPHCERDMTLLLEDKQKATQSDTDTTFQFNSII